MYGLTWGNKIYAKVVAYNIYGYSEDSPISNPTVLITNPDAPINLKENTLARSFTQISLVWEDGASSKGSPIIDYIVTYSIGLNSNNFVVLQSGVLLKTYIATNL